MRVFLTIAMAACALLGQEPVAPEAAERVARLFEPNPAEKPLACEVRPIAPALSYRLAYRAGYVVRMPVAQFSATQGNLRLLVRVTPKGAGTEPLVLRDSGTLPPEAGDADLDLSKYEGQLFGGFYLGEGKYHAEMVLADGEQRVCRRGWDLELKKGVKTALAPGRLAAYSQLRWAHIGSRPGRLTVFLHAGMARWNTVLMESLSGILERLPFRHVQVVAFSLDQNKELLRQNVTGEGDLRRIAGALRENSPETVSYEALRDRSSHRDFLWELVAKETLRGEPADAAVFLGYPTLDDSKVYAPPGCTDGSRKTVYAYFDYAQAGRGRSPAQALSLRQGRFARGRSYPAEAGEDEPGNRPVPPMPDAISRITRACSGRVFHIYSPADLNSALEKTGETLGGR